MKFEELLKAQGLSDEQISAITKAMGKEKIYTTTLENAEERYNKLKAQKENLDEQLKTTDETLKKIKNNNISKEEHEKALADRDNTIKQIKKDGEEKIKNMILDNAINNGLTKAGAKHSDLLSSKIDRTNLKVNEDGSVVGLDEQIKSCKETYKDLFEVTLGGSTPPNPDGKPTTITKEQFNKMGYLERVKLNQDNPELYNSLKGEM